MKKSLVALAALTATGAFAQVTLSGGLNAGLQRSSGLTSLASNQAAANNLTFSATEDLGNGMSAFGSINVRFNPANGFNVSNGSGDLPTTAGAADPDANDAFAQNVTLGLRGAFGEFKAGRFTGVVQGPLGAYDPFGTDSINGVGIAASNPAVRSNGMIAYTTPVINGFSAAAQYSLQDNSTAATAATVADRTGQEYAVYYAAGAFSAMVGTTTPLTNAGFKTNTFAASYNLGMVKPSVVSTSTGGGTGSTNETMLGASIPMGAVTIKAGVKSSDAAGTITNTNGIGLTYALSKRTSVIADMMKNDRGTNTGTNTYLGLRHSF